MKINNSPTDGGLEHSWDVVLVSDLPIFRKKIDMAFNEFTGGANDSKVRESNEVI